MRHREGCANGARHREGASETFIEGGADHVHQLKIDVSVSRIRDMRQLTRLHGCTGGADYAEMRADPQRLQRTRTGLSADHCLVVIGSTYVSWVWYLKGRSKIEEEQWKREAHEDCRFKWMHIGQHLASQLVAVLVRSSTSALGQVRCGGLQVKHELSMVS